MSTRIRFATALTLALGLCGTAQAADVLTDFTTLGTVTTPSLAVGVLTITADDGANPADVHMLNLNGIVVWAAARIP
jgi:hypothetical protein